MPQIRLNGLCECGHESGNNRDCDRCLLIKFIDDLQDELEANIQKDGGWLICRLCEAEHTIAEDFIHEPGCLLNRQIAYVRA